VIWCVSSCVSFMHSTIFLSVTVGNILIFYRCGLDTQRGLEEPCDDCSNFRQQHIHTCLHLILAIWNCIVWNIISIDLLLIYTVSSVQSSPRMLAISKFCIMFMWNVLCVGYVYCVMSRMSVVEFFYSCQNHRKSNRRTFVHAKSPPYVGRDFVWFLNQRLSSCYREIKRHFGRYSHS
jgi:hypothetical protein